MTSYRVQIDWNAVLSTMIAFVVVVGMTRILGRAMTPEGLTFLAQTSTISPQPAKKDYRKLSYQAIESIEKAIDETRKPGSLKRIERILGGIDPEILECEVITGVDDLRSAIDDYRAITREGLTPEEYVEEKEDAFEAITDAAQGLDIDEDALEELESPPEPTPQISGQGV